MSAGVILGSFALATIVLVAVFLFFEQQKLKIHFDDKMSALVDQINQANYYAYEHDVKQQENIKNDTSNIRNTYDTVLQLQNNVKAIDKQLVRKADIFERVDTNKVNTISGMSVLKDNPGPMVEKNYGRYDNRYGVGQWDNAKMRLYGAAGSDINMSFARNDGGFTDVMSIKPDRVNVNANLCMNNTCMTDSDFSKVTNVVKTPTCVARTSNTNDITCGASEYLKSVNAANKSFTCCRLY